MLDLGGEIRMARLRNRWTQRNLAALVGVSPQTVLKLEQDRRAPGSPLTWGKERVRLELGDAVTQMAGFIEEDIPDEVRRIREQRARAAQEERLRAN